MYRHVAEWQPNNVNWSKYHRIRLWGIVFDDTGPIIGCLPTNKLELLYQNIRI